MDTIDIKQFLSSAETSQEKKELKKLTEEQQKLYLVIEKEQHQLCLAIWALSQAACWADGDKGEEENDETKKIVKSLMGYFSEAQKKSVTENLASFNEKNIKPTLVDAIIEIEKLNYPDYTLLDSVVQRIIRTDNDISNDEKDFLDSWYKYTTFRENNEKKRSCTPKDENYIKNVLKIIDIEVLNVDNDIISFVISSNSTILQNGISNIDVILSNFNRILNMYQSLKEYPTDLQETLRNLLIQAITNYVRIIHIYILYASNDSELKNLDSLKTEVVKYSIKLIAEGSCLAEKISCSSVMSNTCSYKQLAHIQKLKILSDELSPGIVLGENLNKINCKKSGIINNAVDTIKQFIVRRDDSDESNKTDNKSNKVKNWSTPLGIKNYDTFKTNIELIIERLNNFQDTIGQSMIISKMIRNYSLYSSKAKYQSDISKQQFENKQFSSVLEYPKKLLKTGVILFMICGGINLLWNANWLLYATAIFISMQIIYYHKSIINNIVQWNMLKHYENIAKRFDS